MKISVSIIVPAYKEEDFIQSALESLLTVFRNSKREFEIIVIVDVIPNDNTLKIVQNIEKSAKEIIIVSRKGKQGIGSAIREGIKNSSKDAILIATAEISEDPLDLAKMMEKMDDGYDMVIGNRFYKNAKREGYASKKYLGNRLCNYTIKLLFGIKSNDITNGVKAYRTHILKSIETSSYGFEIFAEIPIKVYRSGFRNFVEIPITHKARSDVYSKFNLVKEGRRFLLAVLKCYFYNNQKQLNKN